MLDGSYRLQHEELNASPVLSYKEEAVRILDRSLKSLHRKKVPLVKVIYSQQGVEESTWEHEDEMWRHFP